MKSFDPIIFKHLKALQKMNNRELDELQLDFSVVTSDMGLVRVSFFFNSNSSEFLLILFHQRKISECEPETKRIEISGYCRECARICSSLRQLSFETKGELLFTYLII